jgi:hypothetical protein
MPIESGPREALCRRVLRPDKGARQSARGIARPKGETHQGPKTCRRCQTNEIEAGRRRFEVPCEDWRSQMRCKRKTIRTRANNGDFYRRVH